MKTHHAAVVVVPPRELWAPIQAIRKRYDRHFYRWMPHLTMLYPFLPREMFSTAEASLRRACASVPQFRATLESIDFFAHGRDRFTLWLGPEPARPFVQLQAALQAEFPECDEVSTHESGFVPHLSLGQAGSRAQLEERLAELRGRWQPLAFDVPSIALLFREGDGPFGIDRTVPLR